MRTETKMKRIWRRAQRGWPAAYPLVQFPNLPLLVAIAASVAGSLGLLGKHDLWHFVYLSGIVAWALLEVTLGANLFRRVLGLAVLIRTLLVD